MKNNYTRYQGKSDDIPVGTFVVQTSGNANLTGDSLVVSSFNRHSYQVIPTSGTHIGAFEVQTSNDGLNWIKYYDQSFESATGISYSDSWLFKYARPVLTGNAGGFYLINEIHGKF